LDKFEQFTDFPDEDKVIFDIRKAINLIVDNNPNCLDLLFVPERCIIKMTPSWEVFINNRDLFVSKKCRYTFSGYAHAQLERIMTHRKFLLNPIKTEPTRESFGLGVASRFPTSQLKAIVYSALGDIFIENEKVNFLRDLDDIYSNYIMPLFNRFIKEDRRSIALDYLQVGIKSQSNVLSALGPSYIKDEYLEEATKELQYYNARKEWDRFIEWQKHRNKNRAILEEKYGYDCKHAAHLVRLIRMCKEILETGKVNVDRTNIDAEELKEIRNGSWDFDKLKEYSDRMDKEADVLYKTSSLQKSPDVNKIKKLCIEVCENYLK
jgi:predicted nucleotidyltransferase